MSVRRRSFILVLFLLLLGGMTLASAAIVTCPRGCTCLTPADAKEKGASICGKEPILCDYNKLQVAMYCYAVPTPTTTVPPACPSGCTCMPESAAQQQFGSYERCLETPCSRVVLGNTVVSYYCFREKTFPACEAGCECMSEEVAKEKYGAYERCSDTVCGQSATGASYYCFRALSCPDGCTCLSPAEAEKELGVYEKCTSTSCGTVPGSQILRYCMRKAETTVCEEGCSCLLPETARSWGMTELCEPNAPPCYYDANQRAYSCYHNLACGDDCLCLTPEQANARGYTACQGEKVQCGITDPVSYNPLYCFEPGVTTTCRYDAEQDTCTGTCPTGERCHLNSIQRDAAGVVTYGQCTCKAASATDTIPPVIDLYQSPATPKENESVTITARAFDPNGVGTIVLLVDGRKIGECSGDEVCTVNTTLLEGNRTLVVEASDALGNRGTLSRLARVEGVLQLCPRVSGLISSFYYDVTTLQFVAERIVQTEISTGGPSKTIVIPVETRTFPAYIPVEFTIAYSTDCLSAGTWRIRPVYHGFASAQRWIGEWSPAQYTVNTTEHPAGRSDANFTFIDQCTAPLPASFSWQNYAGRNWLTSVKAQGSCGSCWAFSAVGVSEAVHNLEMGTNVSLDLSEQYAVATCGINGNCGGGHPVSVFNAMRDDCGIPDENCFPYTATSSACNRCTDWGSRLWKLNTWQAVGNTTTEIKRALVCHGPLSFCSDSWGHCVTLAGWDDSTNEWIIKNSHGLSYGTQGYGRIPYTGHPYSDFREHVWYVQGIRRGPTC